MHRTLLRQHSSSMPAGPAGAARSRPATAPPARSPGGPAPQAAAGRPQRASQPPPARRERMTAMHRTTAAAGSAVFFALAPGTLAVLIPWGLTGWHPHHTQAAAWIPFRVLGAALIAAALPVLVAAFVRFATEGIGTPAPVAPTKHLVVGGPYRYVRNPIYLAVTALIAGQALLLAQPALLWYAAIFAAAMVAFVYGYEQPTLSQRFGTEYDQYRHAVPGWWPRRRPWQPR